LSPARQATPRLLALERAARARTRLPAAFLQRRAHQAQRLATSALRVSSLCRALPAAVTAPLARTRRKARARPKHARCAQPASTT
jgi:hypothetical protein